MFPTDTDFDFQFSLENEATPIPDDPPFHILFLGDYSGRENLFQKGNSLPLNYETIEIDRDNFDDVLNSLNVSLRLDLQENGKEYLLLKFFELEDFHPDRIFEQIPLFADLRTKRKELLNSNTFEKAAKDVRSWGNFQPLNVDDSLPKQETKIQSSGNLLDDVLDDKKADADSYKSSTSSLSDLDSFIKDVVSPHVIFTDESEQEKLVAFVDETISELMRKILHNKAFQALEAAWRGLYFVVRRIETNSSLKLFLMDLSKDELIDKLKNVNDLEDSNLYKHIFQNNLNTNNNDPWTLICGNYEFELNVEDTATLIRIAKIGDSLPAPFISYIKPQNFGLDSIAETPSISDLNLSNETKEAKLWNTIRTIPEAKNLAFALPKFLTRLPYGEKTAPTEVFSFEEFTKPTEHYNYLWSNPSFICALLLAQSFSSYAWDFSTRYFTEVNGLPTHFYSSKGEINTKPCTEINLTHNACDILLENGFIPLISFKNTDTVILTELRSIAISKQFINGRWK